MNREIEFKVWMVNDNCMLDTFVMNNKGKIFHLKNGELTGGYPPEDYHLLQFIGIHDKNGKKIFEGDIILTQEYTDKPHSKKMKSKRHIGVVKHSVGSGSGFYNKENDSFDRYEEFSSEWTVETKDKGKFGCGSWGVFFMCEVIGNIYENPELLETN